MKRTARLKRGQECRVNAALLRSLVQNQGYMGLEKTAIASGIAAQTIRAMMGGTYPGVPRPLTKRALATFFNVAEDQLFPPSKEDGAAS